MNNNSVNDFLENLLYLDQETLNGMDFYGLCLYVETLNKLEIIKNEVYSQNDGLVEKEESDLKFYKSKNDAINMLGSNLEKVKLSFLRKLLDSESVKYDYSINDVHYLYESIKKVVDIREYKKIGYHLNKALTEFDKVFLELKDGSSVAFTDFVNVRFDGTLKKVMKDSHISLAYRNVILLAPTIKGKMMICVPLTSENYKLIKDYKNIKLVDRDYEISKILQDLELTRIFDGNLIDTRFNVESQEVIRNFLNSKNIHFIDTGYLSLRETFCNLECEEKEELVNILNNYLGFKLDVNKRILEYDKTFFENFIKNYLKEKPEVYIDSITIYGSPVGSLISNRYNAIALEWATETLSDIGNFLVKNAPLIGSAFNRVFSSEDIAVSVALGSGIGSIGAVSKEIINVIKNRSKKFSSQKDYKDIMQLDNQKYNSLNVEELNKMQSLLYSEITDNEKIIVDLTYLYLDELGIKLNGKPKSIRDLKNELNKADDESKKAYKFLCNLQELSNRNPDNFMNNSMRISKIIKNIAIYGLKEPSIYDIAIGENFLS